MVITLLRPPAPLGRLPRGSYTVTVIHSGHGMPPRTVASGTITVSEARCPDDVRAQTTPEEQALVVGKTAFALDLYR
jgi:hypothetical protein